MASMILAKKFIFSISRSFPQTQSLFLRSSSSSTQKFFRATASAAKEKLADERTKDTGRRSVMDKSKQGSYKASKTSLQNVKVGKTKDMAGKTDKKAKEKKKQKQTQTQTQKHWKKPPEGCHVLSVDGSVRNGIAGIGGLIRDTNGSIVTAFAAGIPTAPIHVIEIKATVKGVKIARITKGVTKLIINSDCMHAVDMINGRLKTSREARADLILLKSMKGSFTRFEVRLVCRKANRPADFLASLCKDESSLVFNSTVNIPMQLKVLAAQDVTK